MGTLCFAGLSNGVSRGLELRHVHCFLLTAVRPASSSQISQTNHFPISHSLKSTLPEAFGTVVSALNVMHVKPIVHLQFYFFSSVACFLPNNLNPLTWDRKKLVIHQPHIPFDIRHVDWAENVAPAYPLYQQTHARDPLSMQPAFFAVSRSLHVRLLASLNTLSMLLQRHQIIFE
jgi:hypothetical protein